MTERSAQGDKIAVSLYYDGQGAPNVTAKGRGELAERILALAQAHDIPIHENEGLAAVLAQVPLGDEIPEALYVAIAEVLAFAYYLSGLTPEDIRVRREASADDEGEH